MRRRYDPAGIGSVVPAVLTLQLAAPKLPAAGPRQLLGAACRLFEGAESDHKAAVKPFAVGPLVPAGGDDGAEPGRAAFAWRLGWLADDEPPNWPPTQVDLGAATCPVLGYAQESWPFARLAATPPTRRAEMRVLTPMFFSRNGRDLPLPDPVLVVRSLVGRWNAHAPAGLGLSDEDARAVAECVYLVGMASGRTVEVVVMPKVRQVGFVGSVELGLLRAASARTASVFGALMRFAGIAGVGAQTTHGFGAVEARPTGRPTR
jgi:CRISPR-associated endoribonuclease Cas6